MSSAVGISINDRFTTSRGGTRVAFRVEGSGAPVVLSNGLTTTTNFWDYLRPRLLSQHRVLTWDLPGHGASGPAQCEQDACIEGQPAIVAQLMDELEMDAAVQVGWSTGCQVVLELCRVRPHRVAAMVLLLGGAGRVLDTAALPLPGALLDVVVRRVPRPLFARSVDVMSRLANAPLGHVLPRRLNLIGPDTAAGDARRITTHLRAIDAATVQTMIASAQAHSAWEALGGITQRTLIVAGDLDPFAPSEQVGVKMHEAMQASTLLRLPRGTHTALLDHAAEIGDALERFLASPPTPPTSPTH